MVKILRRKFVIITTMMMLVLFSVLWTANKLYFEYWTDQDIYAIVELLTDSGLFTDQTNVDGEILVEELTSEEPIIGTVVDAEGNILSQQTIGATTGKKNISDKTIAKMARDEKDRYKIDGYIFKKRSVGDGNTLIVAINAGMNDGSVLRKLMKVLLFLAGIFLLVLTTFYLSRFVTLPAEEALEREKRFISDASHELKTPLGAISVNAQALELRGDDSIYVKNIISETGRMNRLIERLLTLSRLEESGLKDKKKLSISDIAQEMVLTYESMAFEKNRELDYDIIDGLELEGSEDEIRQLFVILLDNAIKNSDEKSRIKLECKNRNGRPCIRVKNNGKGIDPRDIDHIFERFYTTDQSRNNGSFGLGLAIAKEIVVRHGGDIQVESKPGQETVFTVTFG